MKLLRGTRAFSVLSHGTVATIGNFDGVHQGHQSLLRELHLQAKRLNKPSLVILFEPQAREFLTPTLAPVRLSRLREKLQIFKILNIDYVYCLTFNANLAAMPAQEFADHFLCNLLKVHYFLVGEDVCLGHDRVGLTWLQEWGKLRNIPVVAYPDVLINDTRVSSTLIRTALYNGNLAIAASYLGRHYSLFGRVIYGKQLARTFGVPTANLRVYRRSLPLTGVFVVHVKRYDGNWFYGIANSGIRPTVAGVEPLVEVHLFDFADSLYGEILQVIFLHKIRDEKKFFHIDMLIEQIYADIHVSKEYLIK